MALAALAPRERSLTRGSIERAASQSPTRHTGVYLPPKAPTADNFWSALGKQDVPQHVRKYYDKRASGGARSTSDRTVTLYIESSGESLAIGAKTSTKVQEIKDLIGMMLQCNPHDVEIRRKTVHGYVKQNGPDEVASSVVVSGVQSLAKGKAQYQHTIVLIGAGLGGMQSAMDLLSHDRTDILIVEKHPDFGGHSWISAANKFTKLQTEKGTYHVDYILPHAAVPKEIGGEPYKTWPSRDALLRMFRENAKDHGLYQYAQFNTSVEKVVPKNGAYAMMHVPQKEEDGDGGIIMAGAVVSWPGNLIVKNEIEFPGEDEFDGYIEYSSFDLVDYMSCAHKEVILYGHGAFTIENVRTLVEHRCKKVNVVCRRRNLCGMKMVSWMVGLSVVPVPGTIMLDLFQKMYDLVGFDVWTAHSVQTDANRTFAQVSQKTVFGVTDVYFLAGYYGLMDVYVDEIKRLTHHCAHTKKMHKISCECIIKAIGTAPSFKVDKALGIKELVGLWINNDPLRPISCNGMFVQARNFGSFSSGPGFVQFVKMFSWFINYPQDWLKVSAALPHNPPGERPAYVPGATFFLPMFIAIGQALPALQAEVNQMGDLKWKKQAEAHPLEEFLPQCEAEWKAYIKFFKESGMVDDRPEPAYPYKLDEMRMYIEKANAVATQASQARGRG